MNTFSRFLIFLHPQLKLQTTPWLESWKIRHRESFIAVSRVFLLMAAALYFAHYFFVDIPLKLEPQSRWMTYRFSMAGTALLAYGLSYNKGITQSRFLRVPTLIAGIAFSYFQVKSMLWLDQIPYIFALVIATVSTLVLQLSILQSSLAFAVITAFQWPVLQSLPSQTVYVQLISGQIIALGSIVIIRSRMNSDLKAFIAEQDRVEVQKKLIESEIELNQQIRAFLPSEIYDRMMAFRSKKHMSFHQAMDEVLRPRMKTIACLFTDIRGYTQRTKKTAGFIRDSAIPNIRNCMELVETLHGIAKQIGDLIFSYFDSPDEALNIRRALICGMALHDKTLALNHSLPEESQVERFILISYGPAIVGNIGGDSGSREITAMGTPANILSRIDELTKMPVFRERFQGDSLILTHAAADAALKEMPTLEITKIALGELNLAIRDFPEETGVYFLPLSEENRKRLEDADLNEDTDQLVYERMIA